MSESNIKNPFDINDSINFAKYQPVNQLIASLIGQVSGLNILGNIYKEDLELSKINDPEKFIEHAFKLLGIDYHALSGEIDSIPKAGGLVVVANHPFGGIDGLIRFQHGMVSSP